MTTGIASLRSQYPRHFLATELDLGDWQAIQPYFDKLDTLPVDTTQQLEQWILQLSELSAAIGDESSRRYIAMTCNTEDPQLEAAYLHYVQEILPKCEPRFFELSKKYLASPALPTLPEKRYQVYTRNRESEVTLYREENIPLQIEDETLSQQYQKICGEQVATFQGTEHTIPQLARYLEETDRNKRREAWQTATRRQLQDREKLEDIFDRMVQLRHQMALNAGYPNFLEYQFQRLGRFDYTPADCETFHHAVETIIRPLRRQILEKRKKDLGLAALCPWDLQVDPQGRGPLRPFENTDELIDGTSKIFSAIHPAFAQDFDILKHNNLLDLASRKGKAPGGYQSTLDEARLPFIFMNATGRNQDVFTLLHEGGHAFHALAFRNEPLHSYRNAPIEFCEVASMGMEMMATEKLEAIYSPEDAQRARLSHLEDIIMLLPWIMRVDAFQHWIYKNPGHSRQERAAQWLALEQRFADELDWSATELSQYRECSWMTKLHFFCVPLYYIEYGIAQLGALQLWIQYLQNQEQAITRYRQALALGNSRPLPQLFEAAGLQFAFDPAMIQPLAEKLQQHLQN